MSQGQKISSTALKERLNDTGLEKKDSTHGLQELLQSPSVKKRFDDMMGAQSASFISSIISAVSTNAYLVKCDPMSVIASAAVAASLGLPINSSLGFAHIVPYKDIAQFQMGWKGFIQLAMRTSQYKTINATEVYSGQIKSRNRFTGDLVFDEAASDSGEVEGYLLYFKLLNGYEKYFYMSKEECLRHGKKYSQSFAKGYGQWKDNFDAMALKTVVKLGLSKYGILSVEMQKSIQVDQAKVSLDGEVEEYPDNNDSIDISHSTSDSKEKKGPVSTEKAALSPDAFREKVLFEIKAILLAMADNDPEKGNALLASVTENKVASLTDLKSHNIDWILRVQEKLVALKEA